MIKLLVLGDIVTFVAIMITVAFTAAAIEIDDQIMLLLAVVVLAAAWLSNFSCDHFHFTSIACAFGASVSTKFSLYLVLVSL